MSCRNCSAVTEVVGVLLTLVIISSVVGGLLLWAQPALEEKRARNRFDSMISQFSALYTVLQDMQTQGVNCSGSVTMSVDTGEFSASNHSGTRFVLYYPLGSGTAFDIQGLDPSDPVYTVDSFTVDRLENTNLAVEAFRYPSGEKIGSDANVDDADTTEFDINLGCDFSGVVRIDMNFTGSTSIIGRIWIFDVGYLRYTQSTVSQSRRVHLENGGVVAGFSPTEGYVFSGPSLFNTNDDFVLRFLRFQPSQVSSLSGIEDLDVKITLTNTECMVLENQQVVSDSEQILMDIYGDYKQAWKNYLNQEYELSFPSETKMELPGKRVSLAFSEILISFEVI